MFNSCIFAQKLSVMHEKLHISLVQNEIKWNDPAANLTHLSELLINVQNPDLVVLPEMFATGFITENLPNVQYADCILDWMKNLSCEKGAAVMGSVDVEDAGKRHNRLYFVTPDGMVQHYDKRHLFPKSPEPDFFQGGMYLPIFQYLGWKICPQICYDLRFPVWSRNSCLKGQYGYDVLVYVANWPAARARHWNVLLQARAIENQAYVMGVNCVGKNNKDVAFQGDTQCLAPDGKVLGQIQGRERILQLSLSKEHLLTFRDQFPVAKDWDNFELTV